MSSPTAQELRALSETSVTEPLPADKVAAVLSNRPFIPVPGTFNVRDLGLVPSASSPSSPGIRPGLAYRSGMLQGLAPQGKAVLAQHLGIRVVFDIRSQKEHASHADPDMEGVQCVWKPTSEEDALVKLDRFVDGDGVAGYANMYMDVLVRYADAFRAVLLHVRDRPGEPFLFHCTAGRDRTGVLAGLLLTLAGAPRDVIALDYLLSRVGCEPAREQLLVFAMKGAYADSVDTPGFVNLCSLREKCWDGFVAEVDRVYGGFEGYAVKVLGLDEEGLGRVKANLSKV